jgi:hypothetical protein
MPKARGDNPLIEALHALALRLGEAGAEAYLRRCARAHPVLAGLPEDLRSWLFTALELPTGDIEAEIADRCTDDMFDVAALRRLAKANADWGTEKTGLVYADAIARWLAAAPPTRAEMLGALADCFIKKDGDLPKKVDEGTGEGGPGLRRDSLFSVAKDISDTPRTAYSRRLCRGRGARGLACGSRLCPRL